MADVAILHGWSDNSDSFKPLAAFLKANGYNVVPIWLGDYISMDDDVRISDVSKKMQSVVGNMWNDKQLNKQFDLIVHSTGGLVVRHWLSPYYLAHPETVPVKRLVMLAPANYGSALASTGKSLLGRVVKGWNNWFSTGTEMLNGLELGSPFQWALAQQDMFAEPLDNRTLYGPNGVWPFVIVGTHGYETGMRAIVNEDGSDGTVRVAAANLNAEGVTLDFCTSNDEPIVTPWRKRAGDMRFPLAVLPNRTHGSVIDPSSKDIAAETSAEQKQDGDVILQALSCPDFAAYQKMRISWTDDPDSITEKTARYSVDTRYHQFMQLNVFVVDDTGTPIPDFFMEFHAPDEVANTEATVIFHNEVIKDCHKNQVNAALRTFYIDRTALMTKFYPAINPSDPRELHLSISASPPGKNIWYFLNTDRGAEGDFKIHDEDTASERWLKRNQTHFVKVIVPRFGNDKVFVLNRG